MWLVASRSTPSPLLLLTYLSSLISSFHIHPACILLFDSSTQSEKEKEKEKDKEGKEKEKPKAPEPAAPVSWGGKSTFANVSVHLHLPTQYSLSLFCIGID